MDGMFIEIILYLTSKLERPNADIVMSITRNLSQVVDVQNVIGTYHINQEHRYDIEL